MKKPVSLKDVQYFDGQIRAMRRLVDYVVDSVKAWDQMPGYERFGRLEYLGQLRMYLDHIGAGIERGELLQRQAREFRNLERLAKDALGTIKILRERDEQMLEREGRVDG